MSLSWRKRQALASDQKTWRGLGHDSALWTSIENNASTVNTVVSGPNQASRTGIVTGLRFIKTQGLANFTAMSTDQMIYASDPSNGTVASVSGVNAYNTLHPSNGSGLKFSIRKFGTEPFTGAALGTDLSGTQYIIHNGGSGYRVGDDILLSGDGFERGQRIQVNSASSSPAGFGPFLPTTGPTSILADGIVTQDAYSVIDISFSAPGTATPQTYPKGTAVTIHSVNAATGPSNSNILARGFLRAAASIAASTTTLLSVEVVTGMADSDFTQDASSASIDVAGGLGAQVSTDIFTVGSITASFPQANAFVDIAGGNAGTPPQLANGEILMQTEPEFQRKAIETAGAPLRNSAGTEIVSRFEMAQGSLTPVVAGQIRAATPRLDPLTTFFNGVLAARVTSVADTTPVQGRN